MKFIASLNTSRKIERPVEYHGPTQENVSKLAVNWMDANGERGDSFSIQEVCRVEVAVIECDKPPKVQTFKHHAPDIKPGTLRCDKCNRLHEEHI